MLLLDWLDDPAADRGIHFAGDGGSWTFRSYAELAGDVRRVAALLRASGAAPGEPVSLMLGDSRSFIAGFVGSVLAGATPSPVAAPLTFRGKDAYVEHVSNVLDVAAPSVVLTDDFLGETTAQAAPGVRAVRLDWDALPDGDVPRGPVAETALLQFTSGSSGRPKGVRVSPANLDHNLSSIIAWGGLHRDDVFASWLPLHHDMGLVGALLCPLVRQCDLLLMTPDQFVRDPLRWVSCLGQRGATKTTAPSFGYSYAARRVKPAQLEGMDFSALRMAILGAERIDPAGVAAFTALTAPHGFDPAYLVAAYGMAEATLAVTGVRPGDGSTIIRLADTGLRTGEPVKVAERAVLGTDVVEGTGWLTGCGSPLAGTAVRIVDEDGEPVPDGSFGEIVVTGASVAQGYRTASPTSATAFGPDGLRTGDSGFLLDGDLYVVGRIGDSLKVRGRKVHAEDLEQQLAAATGLRADRCAVVAGAVGDLDAVVALVEDTGTAWLDKVIPMLRAATGPNVVLAVFHGRRGCVERTSSGKPRRRVIWENLLSGASAAKLCHTNWTDLTTAFPPWPGARDVLPKLDHYPGCLGCGAANEQGLALDVRWTGTEGVCVHVPPEHVQGGPGIAHGGHLASLVDEVTALVACQYAGEPTMTRRTEIDYRAPVPIGRPMRMRAFVVDAGKRRVVVRLEATPEGADETLLFEARVVCVRVPRVRWTGTHAEQRDALANLDFAGGDASTFLRWQLDGGLQQFYRPDRLAAPVRVRLVITDAEPGTWQLAATADGLTATVAPGPDEPADAVYTGTFADWYGYLRGGDGGTVTGAADLLRGLTEAFDFGGQA
ncbi:AMP-binding protein [Actinocorallia sp. API 0066]|uniref:AMP-binding protein n=1 Tax=Actinocorallia sp. API 0066 TaxID=2896846 RepID=UPI001E3CA745|nr:AMP-binding protein [Actinocorallia sp. API 0066]MCD0453478.1 AMP-binding protein [Actinocorallia sp. API 0066]